LITIILALLSVGCAGLPILTFLALLWWLDRYDREPVWLLLLVFVWGAIGAVTLSLVGNTVALVPLTWVLGSAAAMHTGAVLVAPLVEEPTKAMVLPLVLRSRHFDNATDGFVYGAAAGLGFGMTENFLYFVGGAAEGDVLAWAATVVIRTFFSAVMHATASSVVGAFLGWAMFRRWPARLLAGATGLSIAMGLHGLWNGLITADELLNTGGLFFLADLVLFPLEFLIVFGVFQACLWQEHRTIRAELSQEADLGTLPPHHVPVLSSYLSRMRRGWLPRGLDHGAYVRTATTLAFRRRQHRVSRGRQRRSYEADVERLRRELRAMLAGAR
jgi:RsiW-degrading membrane proteinase PrsW (M82 family)